MYEFEEQASKGQEYEKLFFQYLNEQKQMPKYNNFGGNNKAYDIEANGKKYEVKADYYDNETFPVEIFHLKHFKDIIKVDMGWLYETEADFIVFYKTCLQRRYYFYRQALKEFATEALDFKKLVPTFNKGMITFNLMFEVEELEKAKIIKRVEPYYQ